MGKYDTRCQLFQTNRLRASAAEENNIRRWSVRKTWYRLSFFLTRKVVSGIMFCVVAFRVIGQKAEQENRNWSRRHWSANAGGRPLNCRL